MTPADQIRINTLLLEREEKFVRVHELEQAAAAILGEPYPFSQPPLPSNQRRKQKGKAKGAGAKGKAKGGGGLRLRRLKDGEVAYRVCYRDRNGEQEACYEESGPLLTLVGAQGGSLTVHSIDTVDTEGAAVERLWAPTPAEMEVQA
ncbi:hypothetical protein [Actomonas aquatica]|uniref:Uncharacterized protein n=1 Tax=Actomonas aquatica TaxID=2866162 RepID=A0ABZ1C5F3_9BACT|nr:hypothetical protein [Opitutus sp. WL0086]WRQ86627.1 hypothetical protein K1X11_017585 [Opitutus sp. WL0086]